MVVFHDRCSFGTHLTEEETRSTPQALRPLSFYPYQNSTLSGSGLELFLFLVSVINISVIIKIVIGGKLTSINVTCPLGITSKCSYRVYWE